MRLMAAGLSVALSASFVVLKPLCSLIERIRSFTVTGSYFTLCRYLLTIVNK